MHAPYDKSRKSGYSNISGRGSRFLIVPILIAIALLILAISEPRLPTWISQAAEAEFTGNMMSDDAPAPVRTVHADEQK